jgi:hypothetical protein
MKLLDQLAARDPKYNKGKDIKNLGEKKLMDLIKANLKERQKVKK